MWLFFDDVYAGFILGSRPKFLSLHEVELIVFAVVDRESFSRLLLCFFSLMNIQWVWIGRSWLDNTQKTTLNLKFDFQTKVSYAV